MISDAGQSRGSSGKGCQFSWQTRSNSIGDKRARRVFHTHGLVAAAVATRPGCRRDRDVVRGIGGERRPASLTRVCWPPIPQFADPRTRLEGGLFDRYPGDDEQDDEQLEDDELHEESPTVQDFDLEEIRG